MQFLQLFTRKMHKRFFGFFYFKMQLRYLREENKRYYKYFSKRKFRNNNYKYKIIPAPLRSYCLQILHFKKFKYYNKAASNYFMISPLYNIKQRTYYYYFYLPTQFDNIKKVYCSLMLQSSSKTFELKFATKPNSVYYEPVLATYVYYNKQIYIKLLKKFVKYVNCFTSRRAPYRHVKSKFFKCFIKKPKHVRKKKIIRKTKNLVFRLVFRFLKMLDNKFCFASDENL